jgi:anti-sigma factor RsiW
MCEYSDKLVALLDGELQFEETLKTGQHLDHCAECRGRLRAYERLTDSVNAYCAAKLNSATTRRAKPWKPMALRVGAAAVVATMALFLAVPHMRNVRRPAGVVVEATPDVAIVKTTQILAAPVKKAYRRPVPAQIRETNWFPQEPDIQIAIPADAVLPPGAVPEGVSFVADVKIPANGLARPVFVWP